MWLFHVYSGDIVVTFITFLCGFSLNNSGNSVQNTQVLKSL